MIEAVHFKTGYIITRDGRVFNESRNREFGASNGRGYKIFGKPAVLVHRLMGYCFMGLDITDSKEQIHHIDGVRDNNSLYNLECINIREHSRHHGHIRGVEHLVASNKGRKRSEGFIKKLSESRKGSNNPMYGKTMSEENRKNTSNRFKGIPRTDEVKQKMREANIKRYADNPELRNKAREYAKRRVYTHRAPPD